jgi:hypothetical protein
MANFPLMMNGPPVEPVYRKSFIISPPMLVLLNLTNVERIFSLVYYKLFDEEKLKEVKQLVHCRGKGTMYNAFVLSFLLQHEYSKESKTFLENMQLTLYSFNIIHAGSEYYCCKCV